MSSPDVHPAAMPVERLLAQCQLRRQRRSGPGGQHRNKVETAVVIRYCPTGAEAAASERRSQAQNRQMALSRLRVRLALEVRLPVDTSRVPSPLWRSREQGGRMVVSPAHPDFPALLAEALDVIMDRGADVPAAAKCLGCSGSQLVKLLKREPQALQQVNGWRTTRGLVPLK